MYIEVVTTPTAVSVETVTANDVPSEDGSGQRMSSNGTSDTPLVSELFGSTQSTSTSNMFISYGKYTNEALNNRKVIHMLWWSLDRTT